MDRKNFEKATEIMNELKRLHESLENLKGANRMVFSICERRDTLERFGDNSPAFILCREIVIAEAEKRIAQLEKEFNEL